MCVALKGDAAFANHCSHDLPFKLQGSSATLSGERNLCQYATIKAQLQSRNTVFTPDPQNKICGDVTVVGAPLATARIRAPSLAA